MHLSPAAIWRRVTGFFGAAHAFELQREINQLREQNRALEAKLHARPDAQLRATFEGGDQVWISKEPEGTTHLWCPVCWSEDRWVPLSGPTRHVGASKCERCGQSFRTAPPRRPDPIEYPPSGIV